MSFLERVLGRWFDMFEDLERELGFDIKRALLTAATSRDIKVETVLPGTPDQLQRFRWQRSPGGWWTEQAQAQRWDAVAERCPKVSVLCSAAAGFRFVRFTERGEEAYVEEDEDLTGIFSKVVGSHCGRRFSVPCKGDLTDALAPLHLWVAGVPGGAMVLLAIVCVAPELLSAVLAALAPLGLTQELPPHSSRVLAAVCVRPDSCAGSPDSSAACMGHASSDVAYATMPMNA